MERCNQKLKNREKVKIVEDVESLEFKVRDVYLSGYLLEF